MFNFKRFSVRNDLAAMKVGTDTVLLGSAATIKDTDRRILDVGTGTGTIALMLAQRLSALPCESHIEGDKLPDISIVGIDIDAPSVGEAALNFADSEWSAQLKAENISIQKADGSWDLIVSNPPFFESSLKNPDLRRCNARHTAPSDDCSSEDSPMSYRELVQFAAGHLTPTGRLSMILPADQKDAVLRYGRLFGLFPLRILMIRTVVDKAPKRMVVDLAKDRVEPEIQELTMMSKGLWTREYTDLVGDFYLDKD